MRTLRRLVATLALLAGSPALAAPRPAVTLYATTHCPWCDKARAYLSDRGVAFVERDVEHEPAAAAELRELCRQARVAYGGVPVLHIGKAVILGFDQPRIDAALHARNAPRHHPEREP